MVDFVAQNDPGLTARSPVYHERRGTVSRLCYSARLCEALNNVDFFIRNVNVQDEAITPSNKDVNVFFGSLLYMTKHVQAGLVEISSIDSLVRLGELLTGGSDAFQDNPLISFIACLIKSPLQMVEDTTQKVIEIAKRGLPLVISSSPQGGSTAPIQEEGMVILINAEILAGMTLAQLVNPGTPLLYGAVPVRARLDNLHDFYGAPEFVQYNIDCAQMARFYQVPCYSTAGVGDSKVPGMQATVEKVFSQLAVAQSGAQYIHYALGLLDRTSIFSPVQAIIDDANISLVREVLRQPTIDGAAAAASVEEIGKVLSSSTRLFARHIRKQMRRGIVSQPYALQGDGNHDEILQNACNRLNEIQEMPDKRLPAEIINAIYEEIPGLLSREHFLL
jgi:trimethylamine--corrinoid protein Co-methyltransferase